MRHARWRRVLPLYSFLALGSMACREPGLCASTSWHGCVAGSSQEKSQLLFHQLASVTRYLTEELWMNYTLTYGSLLGLIKYNTINPHDSDNDIALRNSDFGRLLVHDQRVMKSKYGLSMSLDRDAGVLRLCTHPTHRASTPARCTDSEAGTTFVPCTILHPTAWAPFDLPPHIVLRSDCMLRPYMLNGTLPIVSCNYQFADELLSIKYGYNYFHDANYRMPESSRLWIH